MPLLNVSVYWRKGHFCNHNFRCFIGFVSFTWFDFQVGFSVKCVFFFFLYFLPSLIVFWNFRTWEISRNSYGQKGKLKKQNFVVGDFMHVMWLTKMTHASQEFLGKRQQCFWLLAFDDKEYVPSEFREYSPFCCSTFQIPLWKWVWLRFLRSFHHIRHLVWYGLDLEHDCHKHWQVRKAVMNWIRA